MERPWPCKNLSFASAVCHCVWIIAVWAFHTQWFNDTAKSTFVEHQYTKAKHKTYAYLLWYIVRIRMGININDIILHGSAFTLQLKCGCTSRWKTFFVCLIRVCIDLANGIWVVNSLPLIQYLDRNRYGVGNNRRYIETQMKCTL